MDLIQLKMPPDQAALMADAIERDIEARPHEATSTELRKTLVWLRYRVQRWNNNHPTTPAA
jgi:hypothetical protein